MKYVVGVGGFEPPTSSSRTKRASRAALHPVLFSYTLRKSYEAKNNIIRSNSLNMTLNFGKLFENQIVNELNRFALKLLFLFNYCNILEDFDKGLLKNDYKKTIYHN